MATTFFATPVERLATFFDPSQPRETYEDAEIDEIASLLERCVHAGSKCPRTYIVLRTIGELDVLERLLIEGFTDQWFPVEHRGLPSFLSPSTKTKFVQSQSIVMTKSLDLEHGRHRHFAPGEPLPFEILGRLGSGGYGQVDKIASKISFRHYALKRIRRRAAFGNNSKEAMKRFKSEIQIVKSIEHRHIIQYVGSYTDKTYLGLVMAPVADTDLAAFLEQTCIYIQTASSANAESSVLRLRDQALASEMSSTVRTYFGCLAAALSYLHDRSIKHKDVKPQNILVHQGNVLLTDFGLSRDFAEDVGSTTSGITPASPRYSPPEVAVYEARNTSADVWSLGCVFLEMVAALHGHNVDWMKHYFATSHSMSSHFYANPEATSQLIREWDSTWTARDRKPLQWIESMLQMNRLSRPTAAQIFEFATSGDEIGQSPTTFCGICCVSDEETDSCDSLVDEPTILPPPTRQAILSPTIIQTYHEGPAAESTEEGTSTIELTPEASVPATMVHNNAEYDTSFILNSASIESSHPSHEVEPEHTGLDHDNGASLSYTDSISSLTQSKMPVATINRKPLAALSKKQKDITLHRRIGADELPKMVNQVRVDVPNEAPPDYDQKIVINAPNETLQSPSEPPGNTRLGEEQPRKIQSQSQSQRTDEGETSSEETLESRVARIKVRVAELTGTTESKPAPASDSLPESQKTANKDDEMDKLKMSPKTMDRLRRSYLLPDIPAQEDSLSSQLENLGYPLSDGTVGNEADFREQENSSSVVKGSGSSSIPTSARTKRDLKSWWSTFSKKGSKGEKQPSTEPARGIFGVSLLTSIPYANVAISLFNEEGESYIYGYIPIVVAKCVVFLKEKGVKVPGALTIPGNEKRVKELKVAFDTPPRWGKGLDWTGYTIFDAATVLNRYLTSLPEPLIDTPIANRMMFPSMSELFRHPDTSEVDSLVRTYQSAIRDLPSLNRQMLLYLLDAFAVFVSQSDLNGATTDHIVDMYHPVFFEDNLYDVEKIVRNKFALKFLIDNQDHFLVGNFLPGGEEEQTSKK